MQDKRYFNIRLEFDRKRFDRIVFQAIADGRAGYVCSVESNNIAVANTDHTFLPVLNGALVNNCDGSVVAKLLSIVRGERLEAYIGADIFIKYVSMKRFRQYFLGNTPQVLDGLRASLSKIDPAVADMPFESLPFCTADSFDYKSIASKINAYAPDIVWVSLGAPKQEMFMSRLLPYLDRGVMFGFGAIFNFNANVGPVRRAPAWMLSLRLEWLYRAVTEPRKAIPRYWRFVKILPRLLTEEKNSVNTVDTN